MKVRGPNPADASGDDAAPGQSIPTNGRTGEWPSQRRWGVVLGPIVGLFLLTLVVVVLGVLLVPAGGRDVASRLSLPISDRMVAASAGVAIAGAWLAVFQLLRGRLRALLRVRSSLAAFTRGERSVGALKVAGDAMEPAAWNAFLDWASETRAASLIASASAGSDASPASGAESGVSVRELADAMWFGVLVVDEQLTVRYANGAAAIQLRVRRDELRGADVRRVVSEERALEAIRAAASGGVKQRAVVETGEASDPDGAVLRFGVRPIEHERAPAALVVIEDLTQQRIADESRRSFVAQAAHELRSPLTNITLYVEQLIENEVDEHERAGALNVINQESRRLGRIVSEMLSIAEIESGRMGLHVDDIRVGPMIDEIEADFRQHAESKRLSLVFERPPKYPSVHGDRAKVMAAFQNLLGNAVKYTPEGGTVRVSVGVECGRLVIEVSDTGIGIAPDEVGRVFERFYRSKDKRVAEVTGTGLGLALAREVARLHGGDITVESELDKGSVFRMWLPTASGENAEPLTRAA